MSFQLTHILRGPNGELELSRVISAFGGLVYIIGANVFQGWEIFGLGKDFDITAYCLAFPGGLAVAVTGGAAGVAIKDRNVATAKIISETGSQPATPPQPAPQVNPELASGDASKSFAPSDEKAAPWNEMK